MLLLADISAGTHSAKSVSPSLTSIRGAEIQYVMNHVGWLDTTTFYRYYSVKPVTLLIIKNLKLIN